ncbi:probable E3 ubiquitin-protein ligase HERC3 [Cyprinus carpio]|uniref:Probable E3 ubiquitin-protein ligase HERC3 n=1 Tax=Cyprinus carpio TaxID=7962 RepID=A0A9Q9YBD3_CYPCA|nr:probable E3 ubiquitin-protein ligase HERC3 [Cyprinus carpio]
MMLCWGSSASGQLGIGVSEAFVFEPRSCCMFDGRGLKEVACGSQHSLFLLHDGSVYACGSNSCGQLGHDKGGWRPELVGALDAQKIAGVSCGQAHSLAVNEQGQVFAWGAGEGGQLGLGTAEEAVRVPRLIKKLCEHRISQVMCGNQHCIALSKDGQLFVWGENSSGQLGLGKGEPSTLSPQPLKSLCGIPLAQISAGGDHSFALSLSGAVFGWGKNSAGQLGLNDEQGKTHADLEVQNLFFLCYIRLVCSQKVVYISCGEEHTAALTKEGGLFTFGNGSRGQLGHDSTRNEPLPRRVMELMGTEVSQIACGRHHTLAFVPSTGLVYAFGCNTQGQLGTGLRGNAKSPLPVGNIQPLCIGNTHTKGERYTICKIHSGGDHNFLLLSTKEGASCPEDFRIMNTTKSIALINSESLDSWRMKLHDNSDSSITNDIILLFSSTACWNASFLDQSDDGHFKTNPKVPGIDFNAVRLLFETLMKPAFARLLEQATKSFESLLIPQLTCSPPDVEAMRIYLILSECPALQDSKNYISLTIPLAMAILRLDANPSKVLDNWWSLMDCEVFSRLVEMYKSIVVFLLTGGKALLMPVFLESYTSAALRLLEKLHKVNLKAQLVEYNHFYIPDISRFVGMKMRYPPVQGSVTLCAYPFILNAQAKTTVLQTDAELQMQMAVSGANLHNVFMLLTMEPLLARNPFLVLHVRRNLLVSDALRELTVYNDVDLKKPLKVIFDGEEAVDAGGVTKEFFLLLFKELMDPIYGMFTQYSESNLLWFSDKSLKDELHLVHRHHTLVSVASSKMIYSFGCGMQGQLGNGEMIKQSVPFPVDLPTECNHDYTIEKIIAGENHSFALFFKELESKGKSNPSRPVLTLNDRMIDRWLSGTDPWATIKQEINTVFSSAASLNGSFLKTSCDDHYQTSEDHCGLDFDLVKSSFAKLSGNKSLISEWVVQQTLLPSLNPNPVGVESLRVYLLLPELIRRLKKQKTELTEALASKILQLDPDSHKVLEKYWSKLPDDWLNSLVKLFHNASAELIEQISCDEMDCDLTRRLKKFLKILQMIYQVCCSANRDIPNRDFIIHEISDLLDTLQATLDKLFLPVLGFVLSDDLEDMVKLKDYCFETINILVKFPFVADTVSKKKMFCYLQVLFQSLPDPHRIILNGNVLHINRESVLTDTLKYLRQKTHAFRYPLQVTFIGENGVDMRGLSAEFFFLLSQSLVKWEKKVLEIHESSLVWFNPDGMQDDSDFYYLGVIFGMALYNQHYINLDFPLALYKKLLQLSPTLNDLEELSPVDTIKTTKYNYKKHFIHCSVTEQVILIVFQKSRIRTLKSLLEEDEDEVVDMFSFDFTVNGEKLIPNGDQIRVTKANRQKYVDLYVDFVFNKSVKNQFEHFSRGFFKGCPFDFWSMFHPEELQELLHGSPEYEWKELQQCASYEKCSASDELIKNFWTEYHYYLPHIIYFFLVFLYGTDRVPVGGFSKRSLKISQLVCPDAEDRLPEAQTCFGKLILPKYSDTNTLRDKLIHVINFCKVFGRA